MSSAAADTRRQTFSARIGYEFRDAALLERALTHKSFTNEHREPRSPNNERLEFLGDAVLGFVVGEHIYRFFPDLQEGALSKIKAHLVSAATLAAKGAGPRDRPFPPDGSGGGPLRRRREALAHRRRLRGADRRDLPGRRPAGGRRTSSGGPSGPRSPGSTSATSPSTTTRRRSRRRRRGWACRCRTTGSSRSSGRTTRRRSWWSSRGTAPPSPRDGGRPSARPSGRRPRKR